MGKPKISGVVAEHKGRFTAEQTSGLLASFYVTVALDAISHFTPTISKSQAAILLSRGEEVAEDIVNRFKSSLFTEKHIYRLMQETYVIRLKDLAPDTIVSDDSREFGFNLAKAFGQGTLKAPQAMLKVISEVMEEDIFDGIRRN